MFTLQSHKYLVVINNPALPLDILLEHEEQLQYLSKHWQYPPLQKVEQNWNFGGRAHCLCIPQLFGTYPRSLAKARQSSCEHFSRPWPPLQLKPAEVKYNKLPVSSYCTSPPWSRMAISRSLSFLQSVSRSMLLKALLREAMLAERGSLVLCPSLE